MTNTRPPAISPGTEPKREGQVLTADNGNFTYEDSSTGSATRYWLRCDAAGANCGVLSSEPTYTLVAADVGAIIRLRVTATCADNCTPATADSAATGVIRSDPSNEVPPAITGELELGQPLELFTGQWSGTQPIFFGIQWQSCRTRRPRDCVDITGATEPSYVPTVADLNERLRALVTADNARPGSQSLATPLTEPLVGRLLSPFPRVAIGGRLAPAGARLTLLRVRGPSGALVAARCRGRTCPPERIRRSIGSKGVVRIRKLERRLGAGARLVIRVTRPSVIGKYTRFRIRRNKPPARLDACLLPGSRRPVACPAG